MNIILPVGVAELYLDLGAKDFTTGARINVDEEIDDEDWVDVGDDGNGSDRTNEDGMDIQNQWVFVIKGQII